MELDMENPGIFSVKKFIIFVVLTILIFVFLYFSKIYGLTDDNTYKVTRVTDGDTIEVESKSEKFSVRLIGIDTPELHKPNTPIQCYAEAAQKYLEPIILGKNVKLVKDVEDQDKYQRKLRYVFLNEENVNMKIVQDGYAYLLTIPPNTLYQSTFRVAALEAMRNSRGLWSACVNVDDRVVQQIKDFGEGLKVPEKIVESSNSSNNISQSSSISATNSNTTISTSSSTTSKDCLIKGNVNTKKDKIYHLPGMRFYDKTNINAAEGDKWFCSEKEAIDAGFRKSSQ